MAPPFPSQAEAGDALPSNDHPAPSEPSAKDGPRTPRQNAAHHTPGSASKRKPRKLAVNFDAAKVSE